MNYLLSFLLSTEKRSERFLLFRSSSISLILLALACAGEVSGQVINGMPPPNGPDHSLVDGSSWQTPELRQLLERTHDLVRQKRYDEAVVVCRSIADVCTKSYSGKSRCEAVAQASLAFVYFNQGNLRQAEEMYTALLNSAKESNNAVMTAQIYGILGGIYLKQADYKKAEEFLTRTLDLDEQLNGKDSRVLLDVLNLLGSVYVQARSYVKASLSYRRALGILEKIYPSDSPYLASDLAELAFIDKEIPDYSEGIVLGKKALKIFQRNPDDNSAARALFFSEELCIRNGDFEFAELLDRAGYPYLEKKSQNGEDLRIPYLLEFAQIYESKGQTGSATLLMLRAVGTAKEAKSSELGSLTDHLAELYERKGDYVNAVTFRKQYLEIIENLLGAESSQLVDPLNKLADAYGKLGDYANSELVYSHAIAILEKEPGQEITLLRTTCNLAWCYFQANDYTRAESLFEKALMISEKEWGSEGPLVAIPLDGLGFLYYWQKDYTKAEPLLQRALTIELNHNANEIGMITLIKSNLAYLYSARSEHWKAEILLKEVLESREKALGPKDPQVSDALTSLALVYENENNYGGALPLFERALAIREDALGLDSIAVANSAQNLGWLFARLGNDRQAQIFFERALKIREKAFGQNSPLIASSLNDFAYLYISRRDFAKAMPLAERSLTILETTPSSKKSEISEALNALGLIYMSSGHFDKAESSFERSIRLHQEVYGIDNVGRLNLALLYIARGEYSKAEPLIIKSIELVEKQSGLLAPDLATTLTELAYLYGAKGEIEHSVSALTRGTDITEHNISLWLATATGTEEQKHALISMRDIIYETHGAVSLHVQFAPQNPDALRLALTTVLRRKGRVLDAVSNSMQTLHKQLNPEDQRLLEQLTKVRSRLAGVVMSGQGSGDYLTRQNEVDKLQAEAQRLESSISARGAESALALQPVTIERVRAHIPEDAALVEIVSYRPFNVHHQNDAEMWGPWHYAAYVLRRDGVPTWADLGEAAEIDEEVARMRAALRDPQRRDVKQLARAVDERVMRPIRRLLGNSHSILLSPDGDLNLLPFAALVDEQNRYLIENYSITYLSSGRDLLRIGAHAPIKQGSVIVANPLFEGVIRSSSTGTASGQNTTGTRSLDFAHAIFPPLPGTAEEAKALATILPNAKVLTEAQATEAAVKHVNGPSILHIATHGFFLANQKTQATETRGLAIPKEDNAPIALPMNISENPLLRSGLAFYGANQRNDGDGDDGILTALEAAQLDLWGTRLVVLSACETGVGDVQNGDGVYGLRRALVIAGAETQVMSLWQVNDKATRDLMINFYTRLQRGEGRSDALRDAELDMLHEKDTSHPFYWAGFIPSGDWTRIDTR